MSLSISTAWEHNLFNSAEGASHLVVTIAAPNEAPVERAPLDLAFALDRSGSMQGADKIGLVKQAVIAALHHLREDDRVALVAFDSDVSTLHNLTPLDTAHRDHLVAVTQSIEAGSSTNLSGGWLEACRQLSHIDPGSSRIRRSLLLTDGQANDGITQPLRLAKHASELRGRGISTSAIGVGYGFDETLLSMMAEAGAGNFQYIAHANELEAFFADEIRSLSTMVAANPFLDIAMPTGVQLELINAFPHETHRNHITVDMRDLAAGEELKLVFAVTSRHVRGESLAPDLHLHWSDPATGAVEEVNEPGTSIPVGSGTPVRNDAAAATVAVELVSREHREAVRLDREGRFDERRARYEASRLLLMAAPMTEEVAELRDRSDAYVVFDRSRPMEEGVRKQSMHTEHNRSRGRRGH